MAEHQEMECAGGSPLEGGLTPAPSWPGLYTRRYGLMLCDPPWRYETWSSKGQGRSASRHYKTMSLEEIKALPVAELAARNCGLGLWVPDTHLEQAFEVLKVWGFTYKTVLFYWAKLNKRAPQIAFTTKDFWRGTGKITRANPEQCLYATRGSPRRFDTKAARSVERLIISPRGRHSAKPLDAQVRSEILMPGPYAYLFSRTTRAGWDCFGDEVGKLDVGAKVAA